MVGSVTQVYLDWVVKRHGNTTGLHYALNWFLTSVFVLELFLNFLLLLQVPVYCKYLV